MRHIRKRVGWLASALCSTLALALAADAAVQTSRPPERPPEVDPYTRGDPRALARLGYVSLGPFHFAGKTTPGLQRELGGLPILWVETEHFRLGTTLAEYRPEEPREIEALKRELAALREVLPGVPVKPRKLDPWLRLHLYARRLEALHADFCSRLGVLPWAEGAEERTGAPALSLRVKQSVLLTEKRSTLARFARANCGSEQDQSFSHFFQESEELFFGISAESLGGDDAELHYALVYGVARNLLCGIEGFPSPLPAWWDHGVSLWFARQSQPGIFLFAFPASDSLPFEELADWQPLARGRVQGGATVPWEEMLTRADWGDQPFGDNVVLWARIDYLLTRPEALRPLLAALHASRPKSSLPALADATGQDLATLDAEFREWVLASYRKKRK